MVLKPLVSVVMITYNHEKYIQQAVEGVLMQQCNFPVELIIADDNSPDATEDVVKKILINHPNSNWVKYTKHKQNKGMMPNFIWALEQCKGKYIALCEGDDYWTDPLKLQKQVDFLEENEEYGAVSNNALVLNDNGETYLFGRKKSRIIIDEEIIRCRQFATASLVFRNNVTIPKEFKNLIAGDTPLLLLINKKAPIYYINEVTSLYRHGAHGVTSGFGNSKNKKKMIEFYLFINKFTNYKYKSLVKNRINEIDSTYFNKSAFNIIWKRSFNYIDSLSYAIFIKLFRMKSNNYFDIKNYSFYMKIFYRIFG